MALAATGLTILTLAGSGAAPARALSCAEHPDGSPEAIASGTEQLSTGDGFFDRYDLAAIGTITAIDTVDAEGPDHGATTLAVDVVAMLGVDDSPTTIEVTSPDPGWLAGYPYELGVTYVIPIQVIGPEGQPNHSFVCDPISEIDAEAVDALRELAAAAGVPFSMAGETSEHEEQADRSTVAEPAAGAGGSSGVAGRALGITAGALASASAIGAAVVLARSRTRRPRAGVVS